VERPADPAHLPGGTSLSQPITGQIAGLMQSNGSGEYLLVEAAFEAVALPLGTVMGLQKYLVRGILGGAVKG
jgi:alpha-glucoside transport system permease protein